jgi:hypothetical protein
MASAAAFSASHLAALFCAARRWAVHQCTCLSYVEEEEDGGADVPVDLGLLNQSIDTKGADSGAVAHALVRRRSSVCTWLGVGGVAALVCLR